MQTEISAPIIYDFTDYRQFLRAYFEYQKKINPKFSNRNFCLKARVPLKNSSIISKIIKGKRKLSQSLRLKFATALGLVADEQHYFDLMSQATHMKHDEERTALLEKMAHFKLKESTVPTREYALAGVGGSGFPGYPEKDNGSTTMYMSEQSYRLIREKVDSFREELRILLSQDPKEDRSYALNMRFMPNGRFSGREFHNVAP